MRFRVLGALRVWDGASWCEIKAAQQRMVLAILVIEAGRVVSIDRLIDEVWSERPPSAAVSTVHGYVLRLRRLLGDVARERIVTSGHAYQLVAEAGDIDAAVFERLAASGRKTLMTGNVDEGAAALADGLALWRGQPYEDVLAGPTVSAEVTRLEQARLATLEDSLGAQLELGRHAAVVEQLAQLTAEHPLRERLWLHRMVALHGCGRRAEALDAYQRIRRLFVEELGIEPGQALRDLHGAILKDDGAPPRHERITATPAGLKAVTPAQLPAVVPEFTGREDYLQRLDSLSTSGVPVRVVITGPAGVGKTALAIHWANRVGQRFPDGQLYVDMRGYATDTPLHPLEALGRFLRALGVAPKEIPMEIDEAAALYRSLLSGRRMLILVDNVRRPAQVRPLVPSGPGCLLVVTGRDRLDGFVARDGARRVALGPLSVDEAQRLLISLVGQRSAGDEQAAFETLAVQCGRLPLALRIAAARLAAQPHLTPAEYSRQLSRTGRLDALQVADDLEATVRAAFELSYATLSVAAQRLFRLLGLIPGPHFGPWAAAALCAIPVPQASALLAELASAHLVEQEAAQRFALHDLLSEYAREQADRVDGHAGAEALQRYFAAYLARSRGAAELMYPSVLRLPSQPDGLDGLDGLDSPDGGEPGEPGEPGEQLAGADEASAWFDAERANLVAITVHAARGGPHRLAWCLSDILRGYMYLRMYIPEWHTVAQAGLAAAAEQDDPAGLAAARLCVATLHFAQGAHREAIEHFGAALQSARRADWPDGVAAALGNLGNLHWALGDLTEAAEFYQQALDHYEQTRALAHRATALGNLGLVHFGQGRLDAAEKHYLMAMEQHRAVGSLSGEARTLVYLGEVYRARQRWDESARVLEQGLKLVRQTGDRNAEGDMLHGLAATYLELGRTEEGLRLVTDAVELARATRDQRLEVGSLTTRAALRHRLGDHDIAIDEYRMAIQIAKAIGNRYLEARATVGLAESLRRKGQHAAARHQAEQALRLSLAGGYALVVAKARTLLGESA